MLYHTEDASSRVFKSFLLMLSEVIKIISAYTCVAHAHSACIFIKIDYSYIKKIAGGLCQNSASMKGNLIPLHFIYFDFICSSVLAFLLCILMI